MNRLQQLSREKLRPLRVISHDKSLINNLTDDEIYYIVVDVNELNPIILDEIFSKNTCVVFISNLTYCNSQFTSELTEKILEYFDVSNSFKNAILCADPSIFELSDVENSSKYKTKNKIPVDDILYLGQSGMSGYAQAAKGYIANYVLNGHNVAWKPLKFDTTRDDSHSYVDNIAMSRMINSFVNKKFNDCILHCTPDLWRGWYQTFKNVSDNIRGFTVWETNKLPNKWVEYINYLDHVIVPSTFNKEVFIESGVKSDISVKPHIFHRDHLPDRKDVVMYDCVGNKIPTDRYTFYSIGEYHARKGIDDLIYTFNNINTNDVQLIIKTHYKENTEKDQYYCYENIRKISEKFGINIYLVLNRLTHKELLALHSIGDCYVSLNKGEGFGLPIHDAYNYGNDVICTGYGGPVEYLPKNMLVDFKIDMVKGMDGFSENYTKDQKWAYPDLDHAAEMMNKLL